MNSKNWWTHVYTNAHTERFGDPLSWPLKNTAILSRCAHRRLPIAPLRVLLAQHLSSWVVKWSRLIMCEWLGLAIRFGLISLPGFFFVSASTIPSLDLLQGCTNTPAEAEVGGQEGWGEGVQVYFLYTGSACFKCTLSYSHRHRGAQPCFLQQIKLKLSIKKWWGWCLAKEEQI